MLPNEIISTIDAGFAPLQVDEKYKVQAKENLLTRLTEEMFADYRPQILHMIQQSYRDELLDSFYQITPFGTGGRRGPVGIGPNRINPRTVMMSAQGHAQFLLKKRGEKAKKQGIVVGYDVRKFTDEKYFDHSLPNPVRGLDCYTLAENVASVYAANGIRVYLFPEYSPTPEVSFMVRYKCCVAGEMISASHNPPSHNGQKVQDETGGQLIPPYDQELVDIVTTQVVHIYSIPKEQAMELGLWNYITKQEREGYISYISSFTYGDAREAKIYFSPYHGTSQFSVLPALQRAGFTVISDPETMCIDPTFSRIPLAIPNPEVPQSYEYLKGPADDVGADIILVTDPDGDRIGCLSKEATGRRFYTGNELAVLVLAYVIDSLQAQGQLSETHTVCTTLVTTGLLRKIATQANIQIQDDLLVGIKYIADCINRLSVSDHGEYLFGAEESHGMTMGEMREKDSAIPALLLSEMASVCRTQGKTLGMYLDDVYEKYGYYLNYLTEIRLPGAEGMSKIQGIMSMLRSDMPQKFGVFTVKECIDKRAGASFVSETDEVARNVLVYFLNPESDLFEHIKVTLRPSGTEPKIKVYIEVACVSGSSKSLDELKALAEEKKDETERAVMMFVYNQLGIQFPERGFLLFNQIPLYDKLKYFEKEDELISLSRYTDASERKEQALRLLAFLGKDPFQKVDDAFAARFGRPLEEYLALPK